MGSRVCRGLVRSGLGRVDITFDQLQILIFPQIGFAEKTSSSEQPDKHNQGRKLNYNSLLGRVKLASSRLNSQGSKVCKQAGEVNKELACFLENFSHVRSRKPTCLTAQTQHGRL